MTDTNSAMLAGLARLERALTAQSFWTADRMVSGELHGVAQHEETLTESNLLDIQLECPDVVAVHPTSHFEEAWTGADWSWVFHTQGESIGMLVQAKRPGSDGIYDGLVHKVRGEFQVDLLIRTAEEDGIYPVYVLYNSFDGCPDDQRGVAVVGAYSIREIVHVWAGHPPNRRRMLSWEFLADNTSPHPWWKLVDLPPNAAVTVVGVVESVLQRVHAARIRRRSTPAPTRFTAIPAQLSGIRDGDWSHFDGRARRVVVVNGG